MVPGGLVRQGHGLTTACSRLPPASARPSLPLPAAAEAQRWASSRKEGAMQKHILIGLIGDYDATEIGRASCRERVCQYV